MPDSFPMVSRSFECQYNGLTDDERERLAMQLRRNGYLSRIDHVGQKMEPIWTAEYGHIVLTLISIKRDVTG